MEIDFGAILFGSPEGFRASDDDRVRRFVSDVIGYKLKRSRGGDALTRIRDIFDVHNGLSLELEGRRKVLSREVSDFDEQVKRAVGDHLRSALEQYDGKERDGPGEGFSR